MPSLIYSLAPLVINSTTLATQGLQLSPEVALDAFRHSGNEFASVLVAPGAAPRIRFSTPFKAAFDLIGLKVLKVTTLGVYLAKFVDALRLTGSARSYSLNGAAVGFAYITGASVAQQGILMADVEIILLSIDGTTHPLSVSDAGTLPTLASQPALHTLGGTTINGTTIAGVESVTIDLGPQIEARVTDGALYPTVCSYLGGAPMLMGEHADPVTLLTTLGLLGVAASSNIVQYFREYNASTGLTGTTGLSLTIAAGKIVPEAQSADNLAMAKTGFRVQPLSSTSTHPFVIATGASVPSP